MRLTIGVLLAVLFTPLAQAELIDEINDRGELRIAVQSDAAPYAFKQDEHLTGFDIELGQALAKELTCAPNLSKRPPRKCYREWRAASSTLRSTSQTRKTNSHPR